MPLGANSVDGVDVATGDAQSDQNMASELTNRSRQADNRGLAARNARRVPRCGTGRLRFFVDDDITNANALSVSCEAVPDVRHTTSIAASLGASSGSRRGRISFVRSAHELPCEASRRLRRGGRPAVGRESRLPAIGRDHLLGHNNKSCCVLGGSLRTAIRDSGVAEVAIRRWKRGALCPDSLDGARD